MQEELEAEVLVLAPVLTWGRAQMMTRSCLS